MKQVITKQEVAKAMDDLVHRGKRPTLIAIHAALNHRGSMSTVVKLKSEIEAAAQPATDSSEGLRVFREVWALAVEEGRQQQEAVIGELRENLQALAAENERLDGLAAAAKDAQAAAEDELHRVRTKLETELSSAQAALIQAGAQAAAALEKLAETQASHSAEVAALQRDLINANRAAHERELELVKFQERLKTKGGPQKGT
jgi:uncharacterized phage infection (PIP) family protein YhgE